jgi:hypothetical protein
MGNMDPNLHDRELPFPVMRVLSVFDLVKEAVKGFGSSD